MAVEQNIQIKDLEETRVMLAHRCDNLTKTVDALENAPKKMREEFISQSVDVFETILKVERDSTDSKIKKLTAELQRERLEHSAAECSSAEMRKNIVLILPKLAALQSLPTSPVPDPSLPHSNAA